MVLGDRPSGPGVGSTTTSQSDEPAPSGESVGARSAASDGEAGLPDPARPGDASGAGSPRAGLGSGVDSSRPDEAGQRSGRSPEPGSGSAAPGSRSGGPGRSSWYRRSGLGEIAQAHARRDRGADALGKLTRTRARVAPTAGSGRRAGGGDPGRPVDIEAAVVVAGEVPLAGVEAHPDAKVGHRPASRGRPGRAARRWRRHRGTRLREDGEDRVTLGDGRRLRLRPDRPPHG